MTVFQKLSSTTPPLFSKNGIRIDVVRSLDQFAAVIALRSTVFMGEQYCPYDEEFDGNDLAGAIHLIASSDGQPIGTMRIRFFAEFAKAERIAVSPHGRGQEAAISLVKAGSLLCARKGYRRVIGHAQSRYIKFWESQGGNVRYERPSFVFSDYEYVEVIVNLPPNPNAIDIDTDPMVLCRPEGDWDRSGVLEHSAARWSAPGKAA